MFDLNLSPLSILPKSYNTQPEQYQKYQVSNDLLLDQKIVPIYYF
jgi:hypothetical protein